MTAAKPKPEPIFRLPRFKVEAVFSARSQVVDWGVELLGVQPLWKLTRGSGVLAAVLDTGVAPDHPDLRSQIHRVRDFTGSPFGPADHAGHGSHCAGLLAAADNDAGVVGIAPEAKLLIGKVLGDNGSGSSQGIATGIRWAVDEGADLISMSLGSPQPSRLIGDAVEYALGKGVPVICAAGNEGPDLDTVGWPASFPGVVSVGAIDRRKTVASFSSRGQRVDVVAPGDQITSDWPPRGLATLSGTSMATPQCAGVVALMLADAKSRNQKLSPAEVLQKLRQTAADLGPPGFDPSYGFGLIDPAKLLMPPTPPSVPAPAGFDWVKIVDLILQVIGRLGKKKATKAEVQKVLAELAEVRFSDKN